MFNFKCTWILKAMHYFSETTCCPQQRFYGKQWTSHYGAGRIHVPGTSYFLLCGQNPPESLVSMWVVDTTSWFRFLEEPDEDSKPNSLTLAGLNCPSNVQTEGPPGWHSGRPQGQPWHSWELKPGQGVCCCSVAKSCLTLLLPHARQAPLSIRFPRQEYWSGLPFPSLGDFPDPRIEPAFPALAGEFFVTESPGNLGKSKYSSNVLTKIQTAQFKLLVSGSQLHRIKEQPGENLEKILMLCPTPVVLLQRVWGGACSLILKHKQG